MSYFMYNGRSSEEFGLRIESKTIFSAPEYDAEFTSIPGRRGDLIVSNNRFKNVEVTYSVFLARKNISALADVLTEIKGWLYTEPDRYHEISDSYDEKSVRYGVISGNLDIEEQLNKVGMFTVTFNCKPFKYSLDGLETIEVDGRSSITVTNPYAFPSKPYIRLYGNGMGMGTTLILQPQGQRMTSWRISNIDGYIEIDSEQMNCYKDTVLKNHIVSGDGFPQFKPGKTDIACIGDVSKIEIIPRWCSL